MFFIFTFAGVIVGILAVAFFYGFAPLFTKNVNDYFYPVVGVLLIVFDLLIRAALRKLVEGTKIDSSSRQVAKILGKPSIFFIPTYVIGIIMILVALYGFVTSLLH